MITSWRYVSNVKRPLRQGDLKQVRKRQRTLEAVLLRFADVAIMAAATSITEFWGSCR